MNAAWGRRTSSLALLGLLVIGCSAAQELPPGAPFRLTDQRGQILSLGDLRGQVVLLTFLYTHCPDTCPLYLSKISQGLAGLEADKGPVSVVVVTVDPERDTLDHIRQFAGPWTENWHFLTGPVDQVARVWNDYGVYVETARHAAVLRDHGEASYAVVHSAKLLILDREARVAAELTGDWSPERLRQEVTALVAEGRPSGGSDLLSPLALFLQRCGEFAAQQPWAFAGLLLLAGLPGLLLPAYLLRTFLLNTR